MTMLPTPMMMTRMAMGVSLPMGSELSHHAKNMLATRDSEPTGCTTDCGAKRSASASPPCEPMNPTKPATQSGMQYIGRCKCAGRSCSRLSARRCTFAPRLVEADESSEMATPTKNRLPTSVFSCSSSVAAFSYKLLRHAPKAVAFVALPNDEFAMACAAMGASRSAFIGTFLLVQRYCVA